MHNARVRTGTERRRRIALDGERRPERDDEVARWQHILLLERGHRLSLAHPAEVGDRVTN